METFYYLIFAIIIIYIFESIIWINEDSNVFYTRFFRKRVFIFSDKLVSFMQKKVFWSTFYPPPGENFITSEGIILTPLGIYMDLNSCFIRYEDIKNISFEKNRLLINKKFVYTFNSTVNLNYYLRLIDNLIKMNKVQRENETRSIIKNSFNLKKIEKRFKDFKKASFILRILSYMFFAFIFIILPFSIYTRIFEKIWINMLAFYGFSILYMSYEYIRISNLFYKEYNQDKFTHILTMFFSPPMFLRLLDLLSKDLFAEYHPVAVSSILMKKKQFLQFTGFYLRRQKYSLNNDDKELESIKDKKKWYSDEVYRNITTILKKYSSSIDDFFNTPNVENSNIKSYCPRCLTQYELEEGICSDCNIDLKNI